MRRKYFKLIAGPLIVLLVVLTWKPLHLDEPWYHGKSLSGWLNQYGAGPGGYKPSLKADEALRHIGTNAVPYLLRLLHSTHSHTFRKLTTTPPQFRVAWVAPHPTNAGFKVRLNSWIDKHAYIRVRRITAPPSWDHWKAFLGFQALGPLGQPAIPDLVKLARDPSGISFPGNARDMKRIALVASVADNSGTYAPIEDPPSPAPFWGFVRGTNAYLIDGEIAAYSLAAIGSNGVPPLMELLADTNPRLKARAAVALGAVGEAAEPAVPALASCLTNSDLWVRMTAADALGLIGKLPEIAVPALTASLRDPEFGTQYWSACSLGNFRQSASSAVPALLESFAANDYRLKDAAALSLSKISWDTTRNQVIPTLLELFKKPDWRNSVVIMLGQMKDEPELVIPTLIEAAGDTNQMVKHNAINFLGEFGPKAGAAVVRLDSLSKDPDRETRDAAIRALSRIKRGP